MILFNKLASWYFSRQALPYWAVLVFDCMVVLFCNLLVYALKSSAGYALSLGGPLLWTMLFYLIPYIIGFRLMRTYTGVLRYSSFSDLLRIGAANLIGIVLIWLARRFLHADDYLVPIGIIGLLFAWLMATVFMFGTRISVECA